MKHSPEPWITEPSGPLGLFDIVAADDTTVARSVSANDARLLMEAPALLRALETVMLHLDARVIALPDEQAREAMDQARRTLNAAKEEALT